MDSVEELGPTPSGPPARSHLRWVALALVAVVIDLVDTFWTTSLRGAIGAIQQVQEPFRSWVRTSALMLPLYVLAVAAAAWMARRWFLAIRRNLLRSLAVAGLVLATTTVVGVGAVGVNAARDYHTESEQLTVMHAVHASVATNSAEHAEHAGHTGHTTAGTGCDTLCQAKRTTLDVQKRGMVYGSIVLLLSNAVLVAFLVVLWGVRLWTRVMTDEDRPQGATTSIVCSAGSTAPSTIGPPATARSRNSAIASVTRSPGTSMGTPGG